jgi:hypothetical protein
LFGRPGRGFGGLIVRLIYRRDYFAAFATESEKDQKANVEILPGHAATLERDLKKSGVKNRLKAELRTERETLP